MSSNRILRVTFVISLLIHGAMLLASPGLNPFSPAPKKQKIEVRYIKENPRNKPVPGPGRQLLKAEPFLKLDSQVVAGSRVPPPYIEQENVLPSRLENHGLPSVRQSHRLENYGLPSARPTFAGPDLMAIKKKITLPPIEMAKIKNPSYISYYQIIREKIRRSAYQNYTHNETGEVYISFIISSDGLIRNARLVQGRSGANDYLKGIALRSVNDASPFPNFPKELDYPQLTFNIIISFEME
jgi:outer membrane biosynthesis protein TonB